MHGLLPHAFEPASPPVALADDEVHLWLFPHRARETALRPDRRWLPLLAAYLGCGPAGLEFGRGEHGKPFLRRPSPALEFNVSHSGGALLLGISRGIALGVDIETTLRKRPALDLARRYFAPAEAQALMRLRAAQQQHAFLRLWSCKEAVLKALGAGISFGLDRLEFALDRHGEPARLNVIDASAGVVDAWHIVRMAPTPDHVGAAAWYGPALRVRAFAACRPAESVR